MKGKQKVGRAGKSFFPFYFRVRAFSIQRTPLSLKSWNRLQSWRKSNGTANPHPPQIKDEAARRMRAKTRHFPILDLGGGEGGGSRFSIYFVQDCRRRLVACELDADSLLAGKLLIKLNLAYILLLLFMNFLAFLF